MALQARGADPRLYNPERDMIWAIPRLTKVALLKLGKDIVVGDLRTAIRARGITIDADDEAIYNELNSLLAELADYINALAKDPEFRRDWRAKYDAIYTKDDLRAALRAVIADLFMSVVYAELPIWFESIQPESANNPLPKIEEVERAVSEVISGTANRKGETHE